MGQQLLGPFGTVAVPRQSNEQNNVPSLWILSAYNLPAAKTDDKFIGFFPVKILVNTRMPLVEVFDLCTQIEMSVHPSDFHCKAFIFCCNPGFEETARQYLFS